MRAQFFEVENSIKCKPSRVLELLNEHQSIQEATFKFEGECLRDETEEGNPQSIQVLQMKKKQLTELQDALERHCNLLSVFEDKNYNCCVSFVNMCLLPNLVKKIVSSQY